MSNSNKSHMGNLNRRIDYLKTRILATADRGSNSYNGAVSELQSLQWAVKTLEPIVAEIRARHESNNAA